MRQLLQMERQIRRCNPELARDFARGETARALFDEQPEYSESVRLRECGQSRNNILRFHI